MVSPQVANGHDSGMVLSSKAVCWRIFGRQCNATGCPLRFSWLLANRVLLEGLWPRVLDYRHGSRRFLRGSPVVEFCRFPRLFIFVGPGKCCACRVVR